MAYMKQGSPFLYDDETGDIVGVKDRDGGESIFGRLSTDSNGNTVLVGADGDRIRLAGSTLKRRFVFVGDSLTYGATTRLSRYFDGLGVWQTAVTLTNLGAGSWIVNAQVDGRAPSGAGGTLRTDGAGNLQWAYTADTYGPLVNVADGGWFRLSSGTSSYFCWVNVRGGTTAPASVGTGAVTTSGIPSINDYNMIGFPAWVAGQLGDTFDDYQPYGISGATSADILKLMPQVIEQPVEAMCLLIGTNDAPATAAAANTLISNVQAAVTLARTKANMVYVGDIFPNTSYTATQQKFMSLASAKLREYFKDVQGVRFWSAFDRLVSPTAVGITQKTGAFHTDQTHMMPFCAYLASLDLVRLVQQDYGTDKPRKAMLDVWDGTVGAGSWNPNPTLRGTAGTVTGSHGVTGTCPDSWALSRSGSTQLCTTTFDTAADGGLSWWSMEVSSATAGDYHELVQYVTVPAGIVAGDYFRFVGELNIGATTSPGINSLAMQANTNGNLQAVYLTQTGRNISTFTTELPQLMLQSEPQLLIAGVTTFTVRIRVGAAASGGVGKVGFRNFRLEKCDGPIYP